MPTSCDYAPLSFFILSPVRECPGGSDCGLFAIAFAVDLCTGKDPHVCSYEQNQMRKHLHECFEKGLMIPFPPMKKPKRFARRVKCSRPVQVYCVCRLPCMGQVRQHLWGSGAVWWLQGMVTQGMPSLMKCSWTLPTNGLVLLVSNCKHLCKHNALPTSSLLNRY